MVLVIGTIERGLNSVAGKVIMVLSVTLLINRLGFLLYKASIVKITA